MRKDIVALLVAMGLVGSLSLSVLAEPGNSQVDSNVIQLNEKRKLLNDEKRELDKNKQLFEESQKVIEAIEIEIEKLDSKIESIYIDIDNIDKEMELSKKELNVAETQLEKANIELEKQRNLFNKRMRAMYINGLDSYLKVLLESTSLNAFISNIETFKDLAEYDRNITEILETKYDEVKEKENTIKKKQEEMLSLRSIREREVENLTIKKKEQENLIAESKEKQQYYSNNISDYEQRVSAAQAQVSNIILGINQVKGNSISRGLTSIESSDIVAYSVKFLGAPYRYGGNGPKSFDCSGFVKYVYAHFGVNLTRTTFTQVNEGVYISRKDLQPGDLVFFGSKNYVHHVGIYVGDNQYIHAPHTGDVVKISPLTRSDFVCGRRVK